MSIEKNPGPDWEVAYVWDGPDVEDDDKGVQYMTVFGVDIIELAIKEARFSLGVSSARFKILGVVKVGVVSFEERDQ